MSRTILWVVACVAAVAPSAAPAAITAKVADRFMGPGFPVGPVFVDIVFEATGVNQTFNENLAFYDLGLRLVRRSGTPGGVRFVDPYAEKVPHAEGSVFPDFAEFVVAESTPDFLLVNVSANTTANFDITSGKKVGRVWFEMDPLASPNTAYDLRLDPDFTIFAAGAGDDPIIPVTLASGYIGPMPAEPAGLSVLALGAFALRRRRGANPAARG